MPRNWSAVLRGAALLALAFAIAAGPLFFAANAQEAETVVNLKLYGALASGGMVGSNAEAQEGDGSWGSNRSLIEYYIDPTAFGLGELTIGDIESISYYSKNAPVDPTKASRGIDFGLYIYTPKFDGAPGTWYGERLVAEPMYSYSDPATTDPDDTWNPWSTETLVWYPYGHSVPEGFGDAPTLAEIQADGFKWSDFWATGDATEVDYSNMPIWLFKFGTGSAWAQEFDGYLDTVQFKFKNGYTFNIDLEGQPTQLFVDADWATVPDGEDPDGDGPAQMMGIDAFATIQPAIDAAAEDATVSVFPNNAVADGESDYPTGISATKKDPATGGAGGNDFILFLNKPGMTLQGVKDDGDPIDSTDDVEAKITATAKAPTFGASVLFIQADDVTVTGLEVAPHTPNKTIEIWGDEFKLKDSVIHSGPNASTVYFNEDKVKGYEIEGNILNGAIAVSSGAGSSGPRDSRVITNNYIESTIYGVGFRGKNPNVGWLTKPVGGAVILGNTFVGNPYGHVYAEGEYTEADLVWEEILAGNAFDKVAGTFDQTGVLSNSTWTFSYDRPNLRRIGSVIQYELDRAQTGDTILASVGLFPEELNFKASLTSVSLIGGMKDLTPLGAPELPLNLVGAEQEATVIQAADDAMGFTVTLASPQSYIENVTIRNNSTPTKKNSVGIAIGYQAIDSKMVLSKVEGFITGVYLSSGVDGAALEGNVITGNANGILVEGALNNTSIQYNDVSGNTLEDDYWTGKLNASIRVLDAFTGSDNVIQYNNLSGSSHGVDNNSTATFTAENNWWGNLGGPVKGSKVAGTVDTDPWLCSGVDTAPDYPGFQPDTEKGCTGGAAAKLVFTSQPVNQMANQDFAEPLTLRVEDAAGNLVVNFSGEVTLTLDTNKQKAVLDGTLKATAVDGVVTFSHLCVNGWGKDLTLTASADGVPAATTAPFNVQAYTTYLSILGR